MRLSKDNILCHELLGLRVRVVSHLDPGIEGVEGVVKWETRRSLKVDIGGRVITILKPGSILEFEIPGYGWVRVRGDQITEDPFERSKRMMRGEGCNAGV